MAEAIDFYGSNFVFKAPDGREDILDLHTFRQPNGPCNVSRWRLTEEELAEVNRTGCVWSSVMSGRIFYPAFVGSESAVCSVVIDYGAVWEREPQPEGLEVKDVPLQRETVQSRLEAVKLGPVVLTLPEGPALCHDAVSLTMITIAKKVGGEQMLVIVNAAEFGGDRLGVMSPLTATEARNLAASLLYGASQIDPQGALNS